MRKRGAKAVPTPLELGLPEGSLAIAGLDRDQLNYLFSVTYEELRRLAAAVRQGDPSATLNPTALVHEAWVKLASSPAFVATSRIHFKRVAARAMRQLLVEAARRRSAAKRGGDLAALVAFDEAADQFLAQPASSNDDVLRLDAALDELARFNPRHAVMVESRFFGGLEVAETAELLQVSEATVLRDWRAARAWLAHEIRDR